MHREITAKRIGALLVMLSQLTCQSASAQPTSADKASAQVLFDHGRKLLQEGNYAEACKRLEQSQAIDPGLGNLLYLADCYEHLDRTASAWALFVEAASRAGAAGETERASVARRRADTLKPRLSTLTLDVPQPHAAAGLELVRNGQPVASGLWGIAVPVDPGEHTVLARAPGRMTWSGTVHVSTNGASATTTIPLLQEAPEITATSASNVALVPGGAELPASAQKPLLAPAADSGSSAQSVMGIVLAGVGGAAIVAGAVFGARAIAKNNQAKAFCPDGGPRCKGPMGVELTEQADAAADAANFLMIGGAGVLLGGAILYLVAPSKPERPGLALAVSARSLELRLTESF
jgi:hypothetical protein